MRAWCTGWVERQWPNAAFLSQPEILISSDELTDICYKAWCIQNAETLKEHLSAWSWSSDVLDSLLKALHEARSATHRAESVTTIRQHLPDWPWQHIRTSELSDTLQADQAKPKKRQHHSHQSPRTPQSEKRQKRQHLTGSDHSDHSVPQTRQEQARRPNRQISARRSQTASRGSQIILSDIPGSDIRTPAVTLPIGADMAPDTGRGLRKKTPRRFFDDWYGNPIPVRR